METRHAIAGSVATTAVALAWANGRSWRTKEKAASPIHFLDYPNLQSETMFVYFGGAFTRPHHAPTLMSLLREKGSVMSPVSSFNRLNNDGEYAKVYSQLRLRSDEFDKLVVIGGSLGAINAFRLAREFRRDVDTSMIVIDPVLSANGLLAQARLAAQLTKFLQPGPLTNQLLAPLIPVLIPGRDPSIYDDVDGLDEFIEKSMKEIQGVTMAYFLDVARTICAAEVPNADAYWDMKVVGLFSEYEPTLDPDGKAEDYSCATVLADEKLIRVPGAHHLTFVEQPLVWKPWLERALDWVS